MPLPCFTPPKAFMPEIHFPPREASLQQIGRCFKSRRELSVHWRTQLPALSSAAVQTLFCGTTRVFITSDEKSCIAHEAERVGISKREARSLVEKHNHERAEYYRYYTGQDWSYAQNYDLCLNTATLSYEGCAQMVLEYLKLRQKTE